MQRSLYITFFLFILVTCSPSKAQSNKTLDSLNLVLKNAKHDTTRVKALIEISNECANYNLDTIITICNSAIELIEKNAQHLQTQVQKNFTMLYMIALNNIGYAYAEKGNTKIAFDYYYKSLIIANRIQSKVDIAKAYNNLGGLEYQMGNLDNAIEYFKKSLVLREKLGDKKVIAVTMNNLGAIYHSTGNIVKALDYYFNSLKIREEIGDKKRIPYVINNIACLYNEQGKGDEAIKYYQKCLQLCEETKEDLLVIKILNGIGAAYDDQKKTDLAIVYYNKSLKLNERLGIKTEMALSFNNLGTAYKAQKEYLKALEYYQKSLQLRLEMGHKNDIIDSYCNLGSVFFEIENFLKAENYAKEAFDIAKELNLVDQIKKSSELLSHTYSKQGKYKEAYEMHVLFKQMADSIKNDETHKAVVRKELQYEFEKEALQLKQKQTEEKAVIELANQTALQRKNYWIYGSAVLVIIVSLLSLLFYRSYKQNQKNAEQQNSLLEQKMLRSQMNPHFIFNSLGIIHEYIQKNKSKEAGAYLLKFSKLMRLILENSRKEYVSLEKEIETLTYYLNLYQLVLQNGFTYQINVDEKIDAEITCIPPMLAQPFIENALKHGISDKKNGELIINFKRVKEVIVFEVRDNGIGYSRSQELKLEKENQHESLATRIVYERLENINKNKNKKIQIAISDSVDVFQNITGTRVEFEIPVIYIA